MLRIDIAEVLAATAHQTGLSGLLRQAGLSGPVRADANETLVFARQLEYFYAKVYERQYALSKWRMVVPVDTEVPSGAETHTFRLFDDTGEVKIIQSYADDLPALETYGKEFTNKIVGLGGTFFVSIQDMRAAQMAGINIDARKAQGSRMLFERALDKLVAVGESTVGLTGFANNADVPILNTGTTPALTGGWEAATAAQIQKDIETLAGQVFAQSKGTRGDPDTGPGLTMVLPTKLYKLLRTRRIDTFNEKTIWQYVNEALPFVTSIKHWARLDTAGPSSAQRVVLFEQDPDVVSAVMPQEFEMLPIQPKALGYSIASHCRFGGTKWVYPLGAIYGDGC